MSLESESTSRKQKRQRRESHRGQSSKRLASHLLQKRNVVFITGAGLSVSSGVRPFRGQSGLWAEVIWKTATRATFRKDPLAWYNNFWLPHFSNCNNDNNKKSNGDINDSDNKCLKKDKNQVKDCTTINAHHNNNPVKCGTNPWFEPSRGHSALQKLQELFPNTCHVITQNVDGIQTGTVVEAHGRLGLFKCIPAEDSDTDSDADEDDNRLVHLGHRRKSRALRQKIENHEKLSGLQSRRRSKRLCPYQLIESIPLNAIEPPSVRKALLSGAKKLDSPPLCPRCRSPVPPQALLFDEGYHSHDFYRFEEMESLLANASTMVFVGTSFNVTITSVALEHARRFAIPVFNFNTVDLLEPSTRLNVENIVGNCDETLPRLVDDVLEELRVRHGN